MSKSKIFLILSLSFILGIFTRSFRELDLWVVYFLTIAPIILMAVNYRNRNILIAGFAILFFVGGAWLINKELSKLDDLELSERIFDDLAVVLKEPEEKENYQKIILSNPVAKPKEEYFRFLVNAPPHLDIKYGDELNVSCTLRIPKNKDDFNYQMYLAKDGIYYICEKAKLEKTGKNYGNKFFAAILKIKNRLEENIGAAIPEPEAALAKGIIIGGSSQLPKKIQENFGKTGMTHIVAVSGYNVTIIAEYLIWFFILIGFWRRQAFWFAILGIIIFVAVIGFPSSAVRAGVMGSLLLWAMKNGRLANSYNAIIFAGAAMLYINPSALRWDIGFQLSFLAALGIIICAPLWEKIFIRKHRALGFSEIFFLSLSAQIFVLPIILHNFHIFSTVSLIANILVLPLIPLSMLLVFLSAIFGFIFQPLSLVFAWLAYLPLKYEIWIINTLAELPWASWEVADFGWPYFVLWYAILFALTVFFKSKSNFKK